MRKTGVQMINSVAQHLTSYRSLSRSCCEDIRAEYFGLLSLVEQEGHSSDKATFRPSRKSPKGDQ